MLGGRNSPAYHALISAGLQGYVILYQQGGLIYDGCRGHSTRIQGRHPRTCGDLEIASASPRSTTFGHNLNLRRLPARKVLKRAARPQGASSMRKDVATPLLWSEARPTSPAHFFIYGFRG